MKQPQKISGPHLFTLMWKASRAVIDFDQKSIAESGFTSKTDFTVLEVLFNKGSLPVNTIGSKVLLTSGSITTAIHRLEKRGLVRRQKDTQDARVVLVHLTQAGEVLIQQAYQKHARNLDALFEIFDEKERLEFARLVRKLGLHAASK